MKRPLTGIQSLTNSAPPFYRSGNAPPPPQPPVNVVRPLITGGDTVGSVLHCDTGVWGGYPTPEITFYRWRRANVTIPGAANSPDYTLQDDDATYRVDCVLTATNPSGSNFANSINQIGPVLPATPPVNITPPSIIGQAVSGGFLTCDPGVWTGSPAPVFSFVWRANGTPIPDATSQLYPVLDGDVTTMVDCIVNATNHASSVPMTAPAVGPILMGLHTAAETWTQVNIGDTWAQVQAFYLRSAAGATMVVQDQPAAPEGHALFMASGANAQSIRRTDITTMLAPRTVEPVEILSCMSGVFTSGAPRVGIGFFPAAGDFTGVSLRRMATNNSRVVMNIHSEISDPTDEVILLPNLPDNVIVFARIQFDGPILRGRAWVQGGVEPTTWQEITAAAPLAISDVHLAALATNQTCIHLAYSVGISGQAPDIEGGIANRNTVINIVSSGALRTFILHSPPNPTPASPLTIIYHGGNGAAAPFQGSIGVDDLADTVNMFTAYPSSYGPNWTDGRIATQGGQDDVQFTRDLIDFVINRHGIDPANVFGAGMSNGGMLCHWIVATAPDLLSGIVSVAANIPQTFVAQCVNPVPMLQFSGTLDNFAPYNGGQGNAVTNPTDLMTSALTTVSTYAHNNGSTGYDDFAMPDLDPLDGCTVVRRTFHGGPGGDAVLFSIINGGHTWPGGTGIGHPLSGLTTRDVSASAELVALFSSLAAA